MNLAHRLTRPGAASAAATVTVVACLTTLLIVTGCSTAERKPDIMLDAFDTLMKRPSITVVEADYQSMYETIRSRLVTEIGIAVWLPDAEPTGGSACSGKLSNLDDAKERLYNAGSSAGNLPDAQWDKAVAIVAEVARQHGFAAPEVVVNGPGDHEVQLRDTFQGYLTFGTGYNTVLFGGTGCHLTDSAHRRGTYLPPKGY